MIRAEKSITGLSSHTVTHKLAAYADDLIFFVSRPLTTIPTLLKAFDEYSGLSNFSINPVKSEALNISLTQVELAEVNSNFPFRWASGSLKYLGVHITAYLSRLYSSNFVPLLARVKEDLSHWLELTLTWFGRCAALKMTILPRILYLLQAIPGAFLDQMRRTFVSYVWARKHPRIAYRTLVMPKNAGGIGLPDVKMYYRAIHLSRLIDWCCHSNHKQWVSMELAESRSPLHGLPWLSSPLPDVLSKHPTIATTIRVTRLSLSSTVLSPSPSPMTPVIGDPDFLPGLEHGRVRRLLRANRFRLRDFLTNGEWISCESIRSLLDPPLDAWCAYQVRHFLISVPGPRELSRALTSYEDICYRARPVRHSLSLTYGMLCAQPSDFLPPSLRRWENELNRTFTEHQRNTILSLAHRSSMACKFQEQGYKLLSHWYRVPSLLHKIDRLISPACWRCGRDVGSLAHIFWYCPDIRPFWNSVRSVINGLVLTPVPDDPATFLLHMTTSSHKHYKRSLTIHMINAARSCIPLLWRQSSPPSLRMWFSLVDEIQRMEELTAALHNTEERIHDTWMPWSHFKQTSDFLKLGELDQGTPSVSQ